MGNRKPKRASIWLLVEFWFVLLLMTGMLLHGAWSAIVALAGEA